MNSLRGFSVLIIFSVWKNTILFINPSINTKNIYKIFIGIFLAYGLCLPKLCRFNCKKGSEI